LVSTTELLIAICCFVIMLSKEKQC